MSQRCTLAKTPEAETVGVSIRCLTAQRLRTRRPVAVKPFFPLGHGGPVGPISRRFHSPEVRTAISASEDMLNRAQTYFKSDVSITSRSDLSTLKSAPLLRLL